MSITQYSDLPFELFTLDDLFSDDDIRKLNDVVINADSKTRKFADQPFKNGKVIIPELSTLIYDRIYKHLPSYYTDRNGKVWKYVNACKYIMYSEILPGQQFGIHTDTGIEYDEQNNIYSKYTILIYLNDEFGGGYTTFYDNSFKKTVSIVPRKNRTLIFDLDLYHAGEQVTSGVKRWIGTELVCKYVGNWAMSSCII